MESGGAADPQAHAPGHRQLEGLRQIGAHLADGSEVEEVLPRVLAIVAETLGLASAVLVAGRNGTSRTFSWTTADLEGARSVQALEHARVAQARLAEERPDGVPGPYLVLPVSAGPGPALGLVQLEAGGPLSPGGRSFVEAVVRQLGLALEARRAARRLQGLQQLSEALRGRRSPREIASALVAQLQALLAAEAAVLLVAEAGEALRVRAQRGLAHPRALAEAGLVSRIAASGPLLVADLQQEQQGGPDGLRSLIGVPLALPGRARGVVAVGSRLPEQFSPADLQLLGLAAERGALGLAQARLERRQRRLAAQLRTLSCASSPLPASPEGLQASLRALAAAARMATGSASAELRAGGSAGPALLDGAPPRPSAPGARLEVPLDARRPELGSLRLKKRPSRGPFTLQERSAAELLAAQAGLALRVEQLHRSRAREREQLQQALHARESLLALVAHDLRNPLATIDLGAHLLLRHWPGSEELGGRRQVERIQQAAGRMMRLLTGLQDGASVAAGRFSIERQPTPALPVVEEALDAILPAAEEGGLRLQRELPGEDLLLSADRDRLLQLLANLLGNALKFTAQGGTITLLLQRLGPEAHFSVQDTGRGISPEDLPHVFERFWQARDTARLGTGLGLSIAQAIAQGHGGRIWAESAPGRGSTFHFTIPLAEQGPERYRPGETSSQPSGQELTSGK